MKKLDFEKVNGFAVDLTTMEFVSKELQSVLSGKEDIESLLKESNNDIQFLREFIMEYYLNTYGDDYIFLKSPNVYQIVEEDLYIIDKKFENDIKSFKTKEEIKKIIDDYNFACEIANKYYNRKLEDICDIFKNWGYSPYNYDEDFKLFDMEKENLTLTFCRECKGIDKQIQVYFNEDWVDYTIDELKESV